MVYSFTTNNDFHNKTTENPIQTKQIQNFINLTQEKPVKLHFHINQKDLVTKRSCPLRTKADVCTHHILGEDITCRGEVWS